MKPFSQACENNKLPILTVLRQELANVDAVLEIGSGTGQHACFFAAELPHLSWQPSDRAEYLPGIRAWMADSPSPNLLDPIEIDVGWQSWPVMPPAAIFTANTLHIMAWAEVENLFARLSAFPQVKMLAVYGPFNYGGRYTSDSNARFDQWLGQQNPVSGIRDLESVDRLAGEADFTLGSDHEMPANNRLLVWRRADG